MTRALGHPVLRPTDVVRFARLAAAALALGWSVLGATNAVCAQPGSPPPPVPPATEAADRAREAADRAREAADAADRAADAADAAAGGGSQPAAGGGRPVGATSPSNTAPGRPLGHPWEAPPSAAGVAAPPGRDPLDAFPPAPAPGQSGAPLRGSATRGAAPPAPLTDEETSSAAANPLPPVPPSPLERLPPESVPRPEPSASESRGFLSAPALSNEPLYRVNALVGIGVTFDNIVGGVNPLGFGFGFQGDYHLFDRYRVGGRILYYVGGSSELPTGYVSLQSWLIAAEGSYVPELAPLRIEPGVAVGLHIRDLDDRPVFAGPSQGFVSAREGSDGVGLYIAPGVRAVVPLSVISQELAMVHVGIDARLDLVLGPEVTGNLELLLLVGVSF